MANVRQILIEFLQKTLHETPQLEYTFLWRGTETVIARLTINGERWSGEEFDNLSEAKTSAAATAFEDLERYSSEPLLRERLNLPQVNRNFNLQAIRASMTLLKKELKTRPDGRKLISLLSCMYPIIDELEMCMQWICIAGDYVSLVYNKIFSKSLVFRVVVSCMK